jgi:hypothetical protein
MSNFRKIYRFVDEVTLVLLSAHFILLLPINIHIVPQPHPSELSPSWSGTKSLQATTVQNLYKLPQYKIFTSCHSTKSLQAATVQNPYKLPQ